MADKIWDVLIIGSGPAGYTAAIYSARANLHPLLFEGIQPGGQLTITTDVENYPGFADGVMGPEMMEIFKKQAARFGTDIRSQIITKVDFSKRPFTCWNESGEAFRSQTVIIATGATAKLLEIPSETKFMGRGVSACATCDGFFFRGKDVCIVGGGDTCMEEAIYLTNHATTVTVVHRRDEFRASRIMLKRAQDNPKIKWALWSAVDEVLGDDSGVTAVRLKDTRSGATTDVKTDGVFIAIGHRPNTDLFKGILDCDENGYLKVRAGSSYTTMPGVFACGDVQDHVYRQAVTAAGTGCMAAIDAERWITNRGRATVEAPETIEPQSLTAVAGH